LRRIIALVLLLVLSVPVIFLVTRNRDTRIIKKHLNVLAVTVSKSAQASELAFIAKIGRINNLFTQDCLIEVGAPVPKIQGLETLVSVFSHFQKSVDRMDVKFYDVGVTVNKESFSAKAVMTVRAVGTDPQDGGSMNDAREIEMDWEKDEGKWKIAIVREIKTLR